MASRAVGREAHRRAVGMLGRGVERGDLEPGEREVARRSSVPSISGRPRASVTLALASSVPMRLAPTARSARRGGERRRPGRPSRGAEGDVGVERARASTSAERGDRRDVGRVERQPARRPARLPVCETSPVSRFGPIATSSPERRAARPTDREVAGELHHQPVERAAAAQSEPVTRPPSTSPVKPMPGAGQAAAHQLALGHAPPRASTWIGRPSPVARPLAVSRPFARGSRRARSVSAASKPMSVFVLEICAVRGEGELRVPDAEVLGADARLVADGAAGERGLAGHQRVEALRRRGARSLAPPSKVRSKPPLSGLTLPLARRSTAPPSGAVGEAGEDREVGDADGVPPGERQLRDRAGAEDREAVAAHLQLVAGRSARRG